ncbi:MAG TPA: DNA polymerase III subunit delta [Candidatus Saccharimonadales bacterium]|nr:DNA polymerase III subunit delta [Candidatus Saccharimonadales bacterium]
MITLLVGENNFEVTRAIQKLAADFEGAVEKIDGSELELRQLPDLLAGATLFADKRLVVIKNLSDNKTMWSNFVDFIPRVSDDVHLVIVEPKPDKRTKTYKDLQKVAQVQEFKVWGERDDRVAEEWVVKEAQNLGFELDKKSAAKVVRQIGVDQWQLYRALEKLAMVDSITPAVIEEIIDTNPTENVFHLFDAALKGDSAKVQHMVATLQLTEDPYRLFGLLSGQVFQLVALVLSEKPSGEVAKDIGVHPYALSQLASHAKSLGKAKVKKIVDAFAEADADMKSLGIEPWILLERALLKVANVT